MAQTYEPKYLEDISKVPVAGPDEWTTDEKRDKVEFAEAKLESDLNDGSEIPQQQIETIHSQMTAVYATYLFGLAPSHPTSVRAGDLPDGSKEQSRFAQDMLSLYRSLRSSVQKAGDDAGINDHTIVTAGN